jgi:sugar lactone lactonase YvrE
VKKLTVDVACSVRARLGEGPCWDAGSQRLLFVDIDKHIVHRWREGGDLESWELGWPVGCVVNRSFGGLLVAAKDGFATLDPVDGSVCLVHEVESAQPRNRMNDGKCDAAGRMWAGTMCPQKEPGRASLYRLVGGGPPVQMMRSVTCSNGLGWSPDNRLMYYIDSATGGVDVLDFDASDGLILHRRRLITMPSEVGIPDGMAVDAEGCLWIAVWGGGVVHRYTPEGHLDRIVSVPATNVTSCAFGGRNYELLYVTSARRDVSRQQLVAQPLAGSLFVCSPGVCGLPSAGYAG